MGARAFDPALLELVDACTLGEEDFDQGIVIQPCSVCGEDVIPEADGSFTNMGGGAHVCPEVPE